MRQPVPSRNRHRRKLKKAIRLIYVDRRPQAAVAMCTRIIGADQSNIDAYEIRSSGHRLLKRHELAINDLDKVEALGGAYCATYFMRAFEKHRLKRYREAIVDFDKAEACDRDAYYSGTIWLYRADCYAQIGLYDEALADCAKIPDDEWMPGFRNKPYGSKHDIIADIKAKRGF